MAHIESDQPLTPSVLDRLIDPDSGGVTSMRGYTVEQMVDAVQRDLEELLNTHQSLNDLPEEYQEVRKSILLYGLPDLMSLNVVTPQQREEVGRLLEEIVAKFEPRLKDIRATITNPGDEKERTVRFRVEAKLCVDPAPAVAFDTILELTTGHYSVKPTES